MKWNRIKLLSYIFIVMAAVIAVVAILINLMVGRTETISGAVTTYRSSILSCESSTIEYPFFAFDNSMRKELNIDVNFAENVINAISLRYRLYYNDQSEIEKSLATNHAAMDISFYKNGLSANSFDATYSNLGDSMRMNLYAPSNVFNGTAAQFFMIDLTDTGKTPSTIDDFKEVYTKGGFKCKVNQ